MSGRAEPSLRVLISFAEMLGSGSGSEGPFSLASISVSCPRELPERNAEVSVFSNVLGLNLIITGLISYCHVTIEVGQPTSVSSMKRLLRFAHQFLTSPS